MNKRIIKDTIIDLIFDKHCRMKETSYQHDSLVCDDLMAMKEEIKEKMNIVIEEFKLPAINVNGLPEEIYTYTQCGTTSISDTQEREGK